MIRNAQQLKTASAILKKHHPFGVRVIKTVDTLHGVDPTTRQVIRYYEQRGLRLLNIKNPR
jgi:hypothetical protein